MSIHTIHITVYAACPYHDKKCLLSSPSVNVKMIEQYTEERTISTYHILLGVRTIVLFINYVY